MAGPVRVCTVDDVVIAFFEPKRDLSAGVEGWYEAMTQPGIATLFALATGPILSEPSRRRRTIELIKERNIRLVAVTNDPRNRGLAGVFSYLGVPMATFGWAQLEDAARSVAARPELAAVIVTEALRLRAGADSGA